MLHRLIARARKTGTRENWHRLGLVCSLAVVVAALLMLAHLLKGADIGRIADTLGAMSPLNIAAAALLVAAAYVTLTFYDLFALRTIGKLHVPYRIAAFAAFASYAIGHNIGATVFTGNAIRFRIYSGFGLTLVDIAKLAFITGLTFWLGNAVVLGLGVAFVPEAASAINRLPAPVNRGLACAVLACVALYLVWIARRPRRFGRDGWRITLPGPGLTLVQIGIGILDLGLSGLAMFVLLPGGGDFVVILVAFIFATLLGFASHAPGGIGVFDAAMLVSLPQFAKEDVLASLLVFRILYYVLPFVLALMLVGSREVVAALTSGLKRSRASGHERKNPLPR